MPALVVFIACSGEPADLDASMARGLGCVASAYDGQSWDDDYLRFVYPGESLVSPVPDVRVTYRLLDAYFIILMLREAGVDGGPAAPAFESAERITSALAISWRERPISNLRKAPRQDGIALDTYAILAYLRRDAGLARVVLSGLDGDGWLPANYYTGEEWFRLIADESWAARAVAATAIDAEAGRKAILRVAEEARARLRRPVADTAKANLVIHALEALRDIPPAAPAHDPRLADLEADLRTYFDREASGLLRGASAGTDTLTLANLVGCLAAERAVDTRDLSPCLAALVRRQDAQGCWSASTTPEGSSARIFTTLRSLLAEALYRKHRAGAGGAARLEGPS